MLSGAARASERFSTHQEKGSGRSTGIALQHESLRANAPVKSQRSYLFVVPDLSPTYYSMLSVELAREATSAGMQLVVQQSQHSASEENSIIGSALSSLADGFFVAPVAHYADEDLSMLIGDKPAVILGDFTQTTRYDRVKSPNSEGVNSAIQHLRQQGCTSIGIVGGMTDDKEADIPDRKSVV